MAPNATGWPTRSPDRLVGTVGAHHEHAGTRIHRGQDFQLGRRPPDAHEGLVGGLAGHQRDVELVGFQQRNVLVAALGVARLDRQRRIGGIHDFGEGVAVDREAAARRRGPQADRGRFGNGLASILRRSAACQQKKAGTDDMNEFHVRPQASLPCTATGSLANPCAAEVVGKCALL